MPPDIISIGSCCYQSAADNQLAETIFAGGRTVKKVIGSKEKGDYLSNALCI